MTDETRNGDSLQQPSPLEFVPSVVSSGTDANATEDTWVDPEFELPLETRKTVLEGEYVCPMEGSGPAMLCNADPRQPNIEFYGTSEWRSPFVVGKRYHVTIEEIE